MEPTDNSAYLSEAISFINEQTLGVISTVSPDNIPQSACVNYLFDGGWKIYVLSFKDSRKVQNIRSNNHVSFAVGVAQIPHTVQIQADASILEEGSEEYGSSLQKLKDSKKLDRDPIYNVFGGSNYAVLVLSITWLRWLYFDESSGQEKYAVFTP